MGDVSIVQRAVWQLSRVDSELAKCGRLNQADRRLAADAVNSLCELPLYFNDTSYSVMGIHARLRRLEPPALSAWLSLPTCSCFATRFGQEKMAHGHKVYYDPVCHEPKILKTLSKNPAPCPLMRSISPLSSQTPSQLKHLSTCTLSNGISSSGMPHFGHFMWCRARAFSRSSACTLV